MNADPSKEAIKKSPLLSDREKKEMNPNSPQLQILYINVPQKFQNDRFLKKYF